MSKIVLGFILFLKSLSVAFSQSDGSRIFVVIPKYPPENSKISFGDKIDDVVISAYILFEEPNYSVRLTHIPKSVDYIPELKSEEIEVSYSDILNSRLFYAD